MENNSNNLNQANMPNNNIADDEIDLRELFAVIWQGKWIIIAITALFAVASVVYAINQPNIYRAEVLLAPAEQDKAGRLSGNLGGLASLAGVNLGGGGVDKTQMALQVLKSRKFTSEFIERNDILPDLMAAKSWHRTSNKVIYDGNIYSKSEDRWVRIVNAPFKPKPSMQEAFKQFKKILTTNIDAETGMVRISVEHLSPFVAKQWVDWLVQDINRTMKSRDVIEANKSTQFLMGQLEKTSIADIRAVLYSLIEEQAKTIMFANVRDEYVFKTVDPALVPELKFKPNRPFIVIFGMLLGGFFSIIFILMRYYIINDKDS